LQRGLLPVTVSNLHAVLKRILKSAVKAGKLASSPMERIQTEPNAKPAEVEVFDEEQLTKLIEHLAPPLRHMHACSARSHLTDVPAAYAPKFSPNTRRWRFSMLRILASTRLLSQSNVARRERRLIKRLRGVL
jgi:hypothetical protein